MTGKENWLRYVITVATILLLLALAWQCLDIYLTGNHASNLDEQGLYIRKVFRADDVMGRLQGLALPGLLYGCLLIWAAAVLPAEKKRGIPMEPDNRLRLMKKKLPELPPEALRQERLRRNIRIGAGAAAGFCMVMSGRFLLNRNNFLSWDLETVMGQLLIHTLPWVVLLFAVLMGTAWACRRSIRREIELLQGLPAEPAGEPEGEKRSCTGILRIMLYVFAFVLVVLGIQNGGMRDVLVKAINICTECIGLG